MKINQDLRRVIIGAVILAAFALGIIVGATVEQEIERALAGEVLK